MRPLRWILGGLVLLALAILVVVSRSGRPESVVPDTPPQAAPGFPTTGQWASFRTHRFDPDLSAEQREKIERLESLSYVSGSRPARELPTITIHDRARAGAGLNLYTSGHAPVALLMDMDGRELHRWQHDFWAIWPNFPVSRSVGATSFWRRAYLYENGDLLAIFDGLGLVKLDKDSNVIWANPCRAHHDLEVLPDGSIWVLTREARVVPEIDPQAPVMEDFVSQLAPDGRELRRVSLLAALVKSPFFGQLRPRMEKAAYTLGANTLALLDGRIAAALPAFRKGNILVSFLTIDTIAVIDPQRGTLEWARTGHYVAQHDPKILPNGNLMLFDNQGVFEHSRVIEFDPVGGQVAWIYDGTEEHPFYSKTCGTAERLSNGNTLITESDGGRAFEVTPDHTIVWEFYNPQRAGAHGEYIAAVFELLRLPADRFRFF